MTSTKLLGFKDWILLLYLEAIYTYKEILYSFLLFCFVKLFLFFKYNISEIKGKYENSDVYTGSYNNNGEGNYLTDLPNH